MNKKNKRKNKNNDPPPKKTKIVLPEIHENRLVFSFCGFDFDPDLITKKLDLEPSLTERKGEKYFFGYPEQIEKIHYCNYWKLEWKNKSGDSIDDMIDKFFKEIIIPRKSLIKEIGINCNIITLFIGQDYYAEGGISMYSFTREQVKILAELNAEIATEIYYDY